MTSPIVQATSVRFTSGKTPSLGWLQDTVPGNFLLAVFVMSNNSSSVISQNLTSTNPVSNSWGTPTIVPVFAGSSGVTMQVYYLANANERFAADGATGAAFVEQLTLNTGTFETMFLVELQDIEAVDVIGSPATGTSTTIQAPSVTTTQYGDYILGFHANRNTAVDQVVVAPATFLATSGAGNPVPRGAGSNVAAIAAGITLTQATTIGAYAPAVTITGTARTWAAGTIGLKSITQSRPPFGVL